MQYLIVFCHVAQCDIMRVELLCDIAVYCATSAFMKIQKKPRKTPTFKQRQFAREYVRNNGNGVKAALATYDTTYEAAKSISHQNLRKPAVQTEIKKIMDDSGLSLNDVGEKVHNAIEQGLQSGKATVDTALRGLDMVLKLHNAYPASKSIKMSYSRVDQTVSKDMKEVAETLKKLNEATSRLLASTEQVAQ